MLELENLFAREVTPTTFWEYQALRAQLELLVDLMEGYLVKQIREFRQIQETFQEIVDLLDSSRNPFSTVLEPKDASQGARTDHLDLLVLQSRLHHEWPEALYI